MVSWIGKNAAMAAPAYDLLHASQFDVDKDPNPPGPHAYRTSDVTKADAEDWSDSRHHHDIGPNG